MTVPPHHLSERDCQAIDLAAEVRRRLGLRLTSQGVIATSLSVSPFVDPAGQPSVLIRLTGPAAIAFLQDLDEPESRSPAGRPGAEPRR